MDANFEKRLTLLEQRLAKIEEFIKPAPTKPAIPVTNPSPAASAPAKIPALSQPTTSTPGNWLGVIAVICFVCAAGFIIKLSIDSGWLTPERQIFLAVLLGFALIGTGLSLLKSDREYASLLPGAGVIVLYLSSFAAYRYYSLVPLGAALTATCAISALCIWLYTRIKHDLYAITAAVGAYLAPAVLGLHSDAIFSLYYFFLCSLAFAVIAIWVRSRTLTMVAAYLAIFMTGWVGGMIGHNIVVASLLALNFLVFSVSTYVYSRYTKQPLATNEAQGFFPILLIFYAMEYYFIDRIQPGLAPWICLGFAALLMGLYLSAKKYFTQGLNSQDVVLCFVTIICFHSGYLELLPAIARPWLFIPIMLAFAFYPADFSGKSAHKAYRFPVFALLAILVLEYFEILLHLLNGHSLQWLPVATAAFACLWFTLIHDKNKLAGPAKTDQADSLLAAAHFLAVLGLYRLTHDGGSLAVSMAWLLYAVTVIVFAFFRHDERMAKSALFVLSFAAAKALLYDAASAPTTIRIFCLLLTGAVLYGCGFLMRKIKSWKTDQLLKM